MVRLAKGVAPAVHSRLMHSIPEVGFKEMIQFRDRYTKYGLGT